MTSSSDLRNGAKQLRQSIASRPVVNPPREDGKRIGVIKRSADEQIRVSWCECEGRSYLSFRLWTRNELEQWWPDKRGMSVRIHELPSLIDILATALDLAEKEQQDRP